MGLSSLGDSDGDSRRKPSRSYRSVGIEVTPDVSTQLLNLRTHMIGEFIVELRNPRDNQLTDTDEAGQINPDLAELAKTAAGGAGGRPRIVTTPGG